jgi:hypothetical protein
MEVPGGRFGACPAGGCVLSAGHVPNWVFVDGMSCHLYSGSMPHTFSLSLKVLLPAGVQVRGEELSLQKVGGGPQIVETREAAQKWRQWGEVRVCPQGWHAAGWWQGWWRWWGVPVLQKGAQRILELGNDSGNKMLLATALGGVGGEGQRPGGRAWGVGGARRGRARGCRAGVPKAGPGASGRGESAHARPRSRRPAARKPALARPHPDLKARRRARARPAGRRPRRPPPTQEKLRKWGTLKACLAGVTG